MQMLGKKKGKMEMKSLNFCLPTQTIHPPPIACGFLWQILIKCIIRIYYSNAFDLCKARRRCVHKY